MGKITNKTDLKFADRSEGIQLRICGSAYSHLEPGFRAAGSGRFDDPQRRYETLYVAPTFSACYEEALVRDGYDDAVNRYHVFRARHEAASLSVLLVDFSQLRIVDFTGQNLRDMGLNLGDVMAEYPLTQELSSSLYNHPAQPHGIKYPSRMSTDAICFVLFDRAKNHVRCMPGLAPAPLTSLGEAFDSFCHGRSIALI
ncbi:RES family NAD+ phosphorylase [Pseudacidovorax sp. 1753]|uniref:RES family NAD+ phosphorylase n=1 Tax=Pseudacidovorax sp. 1753 TaxID=3156419 RepID=UPI003395C521